ncbi:MAG: exodeoxyribonuclease VII small subunit [Erysipelotrichaceae bacterium]|jgi:exodeoxyribonuclease VII small subunit|nr:exodeoxyribonuclease VII small subunit [Erysipelotrichaceae bacterium]
MNKKIPFDDAMKRLEEIVSALEKNEIPLEESIALFDEGLRLAKQCDDQLTGFENKVQKLLDTYQQGEKA